MHLKMQQAILKQQLDLSSGLASGAQKFVGGLHATRRDAHHISDSEVATSENKGSTNAPLLTRYSEGRLPTNLQASSQNFANVFLVHNSGTVHPQFFLQMQAKESTVTLNEIPKK
jgi:hypothetical protein